jgi:peptidoglycan-associated lipoprotein
MMKRYLMVMLAALAVALAGCSTSGGSKQLNPALLDHPSVGGGGGVAVATEGGDTGAEGHTTVQSVVASQDLSGPDGGPPASLGRVILFDFDSYVIKPEYQDLIEQHARFLQAHHDSNVSLEGHTDERGSREYNLSLGQKRAEAVRRALTLAGASDSQLEAVSFGKEKPAAEGHDESAWSQNRRVELRYHR